MGLFSWLNGLFNDDSGTIDSGTTINPASGLPMINGDTSGFDVGGNPYGMDNSDDFNNSDDSFMNSDNDFMNNDTLSNNSDFGTNDSFGNDDSFGGGSSGFDDDF